MDKGSSMSITGALLKLSLGTAVIAVGITSIAYTVGENDTEPSYIEIINEDENHEWTGLDTVE